MLLRTPDPLCTCERVWARDYTLGCSAALGTKLYGMYGYVRQDESAVTGIVAFPGVARYDNKKKNEVMKVFIATKPGREPGKGLVCIF